MAIILDTNILYAAYDRRDSWHPQAKALLQLEQNGLVLPSPVITEVDYFLGRLDPRSQLDFYQAISQGFYLVVDLSKEGYDRVLAINQQYADLRLGFVDAAIVAIAEELGLGRIATTDRRHFGAIQAHIPLILLP
jgi:hypothetical protein